LKTSYAKKNWDFDIATAYQNFSLFINKTMKNNSIVKWKYKYDDEGKLKFFYSNFKLHKIVDFNENVNNNNNNKNNNNNNRSVKLKDVCINCNFSNVDVYLKSKFSLLVQHGNDVFI
jgi:hypothetical protein